MSGASSSDQQELVLATTFLHSGGNGKTWEDDNRTILDNNEETERLFGERLAKDLNQVGVFTTVQSLGDEYSACKGLREGNTRHGDVRIYGTSKGRGYYDARFGSKGFYPHWLWTMCGGKCFCFLCAGKRLGSEGEYAPLIQEMLKSLPPIRLVTAAAENTQPDTDVAATTASLPPSQGEPAAIQSGARLDSIVNLTEENDDAPDALRYAPDTVVPATAEGAISTAPPQVLSKRRRDNSDDQDQSEGEGRSGWKIGKKNTPGFMMEEDDFAEDETLEDWLSDPYRSLMDPIEALWYGDEGPEL
ncbi:hypothetical protein CLAFUW4_12941 [Fulvia fulva]|uniref:Uncharacterized protein n=1 Tax=Passalora fulva TaxID=5499 RepID=A0A9Q8PJ83_PASFU|nr:uncharacterized protein CLAFUR5_12806 [Fulvia fulva]KAK4611639.1 hypothetical protein CLAFUR4_12945 [Fulvia fulva]UJO23417.1 hypothetical protein CLAFUR5_12806 [Fulvia fulva]WPV21584.1 hypothetical protein CLAFUW4_12941 [Fulvia fulva]WPV35869.1 hypothetical protein CLAFUW7_12948 [Fulvia fulva]